MWMRPRSRCVQSLRDEFVRPKTQNAWTLRTDRFLVHLQQLDLNLDSLA